MLLNKMKATIVKYNLIEEGDCIVIGLSGGPDSTCLFHALCLMREEFRLTLHAVHLNHQFRPGDAEVDQRYVEKLCEQWCVPCHSFVMNVNEIAKKQGITSEEAGRNARYQCFYQVAETLQNQAAVCNEKQEIKIAVAQNLNDQAETVLMRIMRGTGTDGLSGIEYKRDGEKGCKVIRPLLDLSREEIEAYCQEQGLQPQMDKTNALPIYTRNKIRLELIPYIREQYNGNIVMALSRLSKISKDDKAYIYSVVDKIVKDHAKVKVHSEQDALASIPLKVLQAAHPAVRHRILLMLFGKIGLSQDVQTAHLEGADVVINDGKTSSMAHFPNHYRLRISYGMVELYKEVENEKQDFYYGIDKYQEEHCIEIVPLNQTVKIKLMKVVREEGGKTSAALEFCKKELGSKWDSGQNVALDADKIQKQQANLAIRTRMQGDFITPKGMVGTKKLKNFFIDEKIEKEQRNRIPLLCLGSEVLWIVGNRMSENYKVDEETKNVLVLEFFESI